MSRPAAARRRSPAKSWANGERHARQVYCQRQRLGYCQVRGSRRLHQLFLEGQGGGRRRLQRPRTQWRPRLDRAARYPARRGLGGIAHRRDQQRASDGAGLFQQRQSLAADRARGRARDQQGPAGGAVPRRGRRPERDARIFHQRDALARRLPAAARAPSRTTGGRGEAAARVQIRPAVGAGAAARRRRRLRSRIQRGGRRRRSGRDHCDRRAAQAAAHSAARRSARSGASRRGRGPGGREPDQAHRRGGGGRAAACRRRRRFRLQGQDVPVAAGRRGERRRRRRPLPHRPGRGAGLRPGDDLVPRRRPTRATRQGRTRSAISTPTDWASAATRSRR